MELVSMNETKSKKQIADMYLRCRYDMFRSQKVQGVPDGIGTNLLEYEFDSTYNISCTGSWDINVLPTLPQQGAFVSVTQSTNSPGTINGQKIYPFQGNGKFPTPLMTTKLINTINNAIEVPVKTDFAKACRMIGVGWSLIYTGAASTCQGTLFANAVTLNVDDTPHKRTGVLNTEAVNTENPVTYVTKAVPTQESMRIDSNTFGEEITPNFQTHSQRPEYGIHGILRRKVRAEAHTFKPFYQVPPVLIWDIEGDATATGSSFLIPYEVLGAAPITGKLLGTNFIDRDFEAERISFRCADTFVGTWLLRVKTCVQVEKSSNFSLIELTKPATQSDPAVLSADDAFAAMVPHAAPLSQPLLSLGMYNRPGRRRGRRQRNRKNKNKPTAPRPLKQTPKPQRVPRKGNTKSTNIAIRT